MCNAKRRGDSGNVPMSDEGHSNFSRQLQDGFAERNAHEVCKTNLSIKDYEPEARAYEEAMAAVGQPWVIVEAFKPEAGRLARQLAILPKGSKIAVYEYCDCIETKLCQ